MPDSTNMKNQKAKSGTTSTGAHYSQADPRVAEKTFAKKAVKTTAAERIENWTRHIKATLAAKGISWHPDQIGNDSVGYPGHRIATMRIIDGDLVVKMSEDYHQTRIDLSDDKGEVHLVIGSIIERKNNADLRRMMDEELRKKACRTLTSPEFMKEVEELMNRLDQRWFVKLELTAQHVTDSEQATE